MDRPFLEAVTAARELRREGDTLFVCGVSFSDEELEKARFLGGDCLVRVDAAKESVLPSAKELVQELSVEAVVFPPTRSGRGAAAALACSLRGDCTLDCIAVEQNETGKICVVKPAFASNAQVTFEIESDFCVLVPREKRFMPAEYTKVAVPLRTIQCDGDEEVVCAPASVEPFEEDKMDQAEVVIVGGRGIENQKDLDLVRSFADAIGGAFGATRPLVMSGLVPISLLIGQSGRTIAPRLCIVVGVSGSTPFLAGVSPNTQIVAINHDPDANIFANADYGIVADYRKLLPEILKEIDSPIS